MFVGRDGAGEERVALYGAEGGTRREEAHLKTEQTTTRCEAHCRVHKIEVFKGILQSVRYSQHLLTSVKYIGCV